ncbi:MAG TPA: PTPDL family protein [Chthoniobacteraceae bacterium]|jgi:hypothetical protein|nr:PTPDL family protein [Chthoniobacteraceae bacterium]
MRRRFPLLLLLATALLLPTAGRADTVILKSGEKLEGKIVGETAADYTVDYKAGAGITDTRTVLKSDVEKVVKETPDDLAWQQLKTLQIGAASLPVGGYEGPMHLLQGFIAQFPQSPHAGEAAQALKGFEADKQRVDDGEVKIEGKWISKEEVQKERYQINGRAVYSYMQDLARHNDLVGALNAFDKLEKEYPGSSAYPDAVPLARQLVEKLKPTADQMLKSWQYQKGERDAATKMMPDAQRIQTAAAQKGEQDRLDAALEASTKGGVKWPPLQKQHEKTLSTIIAKTQPELTRLNALPVEKMRQSLQLAQQAREELAKHDLEAADTAAKDATKLWSANELATRLQKEVTAQKTLAKAATPVPVAVAATPAPHAAQAPAAKTTTAPPPVSPEEPKNFFATPRGLGAIGLVVLLLGYGYFNYKKKKQAATHDLG